jgi:hypothetical protein
MARLIAFGSSYTYGHGLPDCYIPPNQPGDAPSKHAWPSAVADILNTECVNMSECGISNKHIWHTVVNFNFKKNDTVIILWTYLERSAILKNKDTVVSIGPWINESKIYYKHIHSKYDAEMQTKLFISHVDFLLKAKGIAVFHLITDHHEATLFELGEHTVAHIPLYLSEYIPKFSKALDGSHPGEECHRQFANDIVQVLKCK